MSWLKSPSTETRWKFCQFEISGLCYSRLHETCTIELFAKIVNGFNRLHSSQEVLL